MREIKFRVWDALEKEMLFPDTVTPSIISLQGAYLMQYTGLKDNNGKEIYEGDIVNHKKWFRVGEYKPCKGVVKYKGISFTCECIGDWLGSNAELNPLAEVIGNIYQNPELLNQ